MQMEIEGEQILWKEKVEVEETEDQTKDPFVPAKLADPSDPEDVLVHIEL